MHHEYEAARQIARNTGATRPNSPFVLTDFDTYELNPYFTGPQCLQSLNPDDPGEDAIAAHHFCIRNHCAAVQFGPAFDPWLAGRNAAVSAAVSDDEIPF